jgi:hypothetical protein
MAGRVSLGVLLMANFGWNVSVIDTAEVPRALPDQGTDGHPVYRIPVEKFRRGPRLHFKTRNVVDDGAASKGRLITEALEATRFARAVVEELARARIFSWSGAEPSAGSPGVSWTGIRRSGSSGSESTARPARSRAAISG